MSWLLEGNTSIYHKDNKIIPLYRSMILSCETFFVITAQGREEAATCLLVDGGQGCMLQYTGQTPQQRIN